MVSLDGSALTTASAVSETEPELDGLELASPANSVVDLDSWDNIIQYIAEPAWLLMSLHL